MISPHKRDPLASVEHKAVWTGKALVLQGAGSRSILQFGVKAGCICGHAQQTKLRLNVALTFIPVTS